MSINESIKGVRFNGYSGNDQDKEVWDKLGQAIGNLQALEKLCVCINYYDEDEDLPSPNWQILARILNFVRQKIEVSINGMDNWDVEASRLFAQAIHGHPTITRFEDSGNFPYESVDSLYSAMATLPALESINLRQTTAEDESTLPIVRA
jgi:hypothetical protein